nr:MAG TPA: Protein of unknown function (DUF722) [Caudoviricetes sp.]
MDIHQAKSELFTYIKIYNELQAKKERHAELKQQLYALKLHRNSEKVACSNLPGDTIETLIDKMAALETAISEGIYKLASEAERISTKINKLNYPFSEVLMRRYIKLERFEKIAVELNYSWRQTMRLHLGALKKYSEI